MFNLKLLTPINDWEVVETDGKRQYHHPDIGSLPSVTTVLSERLNHQWLEKWKTKVGPEMALLVSEQAKQRGTRIHNLMEDYVFNRPIGKLMPDDKVIFKQIRNALDKHVTTIYGVEHLLYSKILNTAGRTDLIADWNGIPSIIDFKTSKHSKKETDILSYFLQTCCYAMMAEELYDIWIPQIVIILAIDFAKQPQVFIKPKQGYSETVQQIFAP